MNWKIFSLKYYKKLFSEDKYQYLVSLISLFYKDIKEITNKQ